jgi:PIN domain nuclease of toxin-antitoxin system
VILLDTHVLAWLAVTPERLSRPAERAIRRAESGGLAIASVSLMELSMQIARGRIKVRSTPQAWLRDLVARTGVTVGDLTVDVAAIAGHLPPTFPPDPFDRVIAATAMAGRISLVTADTRIANSGVVRTIW